MSNQIENYSILFLSSFLKYNEFRELFISNWKTDYFDTQEDKIIYYKVKAFYSENITIPTAHDLRLDFQTDPKYVKLVQTIVPRVTEIFEFDLIDYTQTFVRDIFLDILRRKKLKFVISDIISQVNQSGKVDEIYIKDQLLKSLDIDNPLDDDGIDYFDADVPERLRKLKEAAISHFKTGFNKELDDHLRLKRKSVVAVSAQLGVGKSLFLQNSGLNFAKQGFNVLYLSLEMDDLELTERADKILFGIEVDDYYDSVDLVQSRMDEIKKDKKLGKFLIRDFPPRSLSTFQIQSMLERYRMKNIGIDVVIVDYLTLMKPNKPTRDENIYSKGKSIAEELLALAKEENQMVLTALQVKGDAYGKNKQGAEQVAESLAIPQILTTLVNMTEFIDEENGDQKYLIIQYEKTRTRKMVSAKIVLKLTDSLQIVNTNSVERDEVIEVVFGTPNSKLVSKKDFDITADFKMEL